MLTPASGTGQALPDAIILALKPFAPMFQARTWTKVQVGSIPVGGRIVR